MRFRSILAVLVLAIAGLGFTGCGSNGTSDDFVATSSAFEAPTGNMTFNFTTAAAQAPFAVDSATTDLQFDFYDGSGNLVHSVTRDFETTITITGVPTSSEQVVITGFNADGFPFYTITKSITVQGGATTTVDGANATAVAVSVEELSLSDANGEIDSVDLLVGETVQTFLTARFSNDSVVLVGNRGGVTYTPGSEAIASVDESGAVTGVALGETTLTAEFGGKSLEVPVNVVSEQPTFEEIKIANEGADEGLGIAEPGGSFPLAIRGRLAGEEEFDNVVTQNLTFESSNLTEISVSPTGLVTDEGESDNGQTATITVTYTNPDGSEKTDTVLVTASDSST